MSTENEPKKPEGNLLDSLRGDGSKNPDASDPLRTVGAFLGLSIGLGALNAGLDIAGQISDTFQNGMNSFLSHTSEGGIGVPAATVNAPALAPANNFAMNQSLSMRGMG